MKDKTADKTGLSKTKDDTGAKEENSKPGDADLPFVAVLTPIGPILQVNADTSSATIESSAQDQSSLFSGLALFANSSASAQQSFSASTTLPVTASPAAIKPKATPQSATSSIDAPAVVKSTTATASDEVSVSYAIQHVANSKRPDSVDTTFVISDLSRQPNSNSLSSQTAPHSGHTKPQSGSSSDNTSAMTTGKSDSAILGITFESVASPHSSTYQPAPVSTATAQAPTLMPDALLSARPSTCGELALSSQCSAPVSSVATRTQIQSPPIPDPPRMVDSGQLRVGTNSSELKISVQLSELGKVEVRAVTAHDVTTAHLTTSSREALKVLATDRTGLEQSLKGRDVTLGSLDCHGQGQAGGQQRQQNFQPLTQSSARSSSPGTAATIPTTSEAGNTGFLPDHSSISVRA
jgi:flagellar hook-length control protein FliK